MHGTKLTMHGAKLTMHGAKLTNRTRSFNGGGRESERERGAGEVERAKGGWREEGEFRYS